MVIVEINHNECLLKCVELSERVTTAAVTTRASSSSLVVAMGDKGPSRMGLMLALIAAAVAVVSKAQPLSLSLDLSLSFSRVLSVGRDGFRLSADSLVPLHVSALLILTAVPVATGAMAASAHFMCPHASQQVSCLSAMRRPSISVTFVLHT
jgi:hypothetical protein